MIKLDIFQTLGKIQQEIKVKKERYNKFGEFNYRSGEDIIAALKPLLDKYNATIVLSDDLESFNNEVYVKGVATMYYDDQIITACSYAREEKVRPKMTPGQLTGSASSYARKYALDGLLLLDNTEDIDANTEDVVKPRVLTEDEFQRFLNQSNEFIIKHFQDYALTASQERRVHERLNTAA